MLRFPHISRNIFFRLYFLPNFLDNIVYGDTDSMFLLVGSTRKKISGKNCPNSHVGKWRRNYNMTVHIIAGFFFRNLYFSKKKLFF